jgi:hypothetical protein
VARDLIQAYVNVKRLTMQIGKLENQLQFEKATNKACLVSINDLEHKLISLGTIVEDKSNTTSMIIENDKEIQNRRGKLNLPVTMHSQTKELVKLEKEKDKMKEQIRHLIEQNVKLQANIDGIIEEKTIALSVKLAKKITIPDVEEIPTTYDQGQIVQLEKELLTVHEHLQKMESEY